MGDRMWVALPGLHASTHTVHSIPRSVLSPGSGPLLLLPLYGSESWQGRPPLDKSMWHRCQDGVEQPHKEGGQDQLGTFFFVGSQIPSQLRDINKIFILEKKIKFIADFI